MKAKFTLAAAVLGMAVGSMAQSPDELRIYINPGHGSWTGNDRPNNIIGKPEYSSTNTDTTGFFESNTNLFKGFGMLEALIEMGMPFDRTLNQTGERWQIGAAKDLSQNIVMSRVKNGPFEASNTTSSPNYMLYNRSLPEIAAEVEYNEFDMFVSIHSNAATEASATNYHLFMYRGKNGIQNVAVPGSWEMIEAAAKYSFPNKHASWSHSNVYINGDVDFMGAGKGSTNSLGYYGYLGVMKHGVPGYLVEGYFHTYQPARHRGMNFDVDFEEGRAYARGVAEYFGFDRDKTGDLYGIVRDKHTKFSHAWYKARPGSDDAFLPLNSVDVTLYKDGKELKTYKTDQFYNGAFVFVGLEPGKYTVAVSHPDYKALPEPVEVEVVAGDCVYPQVWLESTDWVTPADNKDTYPDLLDETTAYGAANHYNFKQVYADQNIAELAGKTVKRTIVRGNLLYALALDAAKEPTIVVYNLSDKKTEAVLSTAGMKGNQLKCSDIQVTADGIVVACNSEKLHYSTDQLQEGETERGTLRFYRWENNVNGIPTGDPVNFISTQNSSLWYRTYAGNTFSYRGTLEDGTITVGNPSITGPNFALRTLEIAVSDGANAGEGVHKPMKYGNASANLTTPDMGQYLFIPSPVEEKKVWILTEKQGIIEIDNATTDAASAATDMSGSTLPANMLSGSALRYAGASYIVLNETDGNGAYAGTAMYNVGKGLKNATAIRTDNTGVSTLAADVKAAESLSGLAHGTGAWVDITRDKVTNAIIGAAINMYSLRNGKVSSFTTAGVDQPAVRNHFAYGLDMAKGEDSFTLKFNASNDANDAEIVLTPTTGGDAVVVPVGAIDKGENTVKVNFADLDENTTYNWAVNVKNDAVPYSAPFFTAPGSIKSNSRGGLVWINDPESPNYGLLVVSQGFAQGIDVYNHNLELVQSRVKPQGQNWGATKVNSPYRAGQLNGNVYLCDWSDPAAGYWFFNPSEPATTYDAMGGTRGNAGEHVVDGAIIGGGSTCVAFQGKGEETRMYTFVEDYPTGNGTMNLVRYKVGTQTSWVQKPEKEFTNLTGATLMKGTNVEVVPLENGVFVAQARGAGNNKETEPAFVYMDNDGKILFNSASLEDDLPSCGGGIAITDDLKLMAISEATNGIGMWSVTWKDNVPSFKKLYMIPGSEGAAEVSQMTFDNAGNLYAFHRGNVGAKAYGIRSAASVATTPAPASKALAVKDAGVNDIKVDTDNTPAVYYNLNGVRVEGTPAAGLYIRVSDGKAEKVVVK